VVTDRRFKKKAQTEEEEVKIIADDTKTESHTGIQYTLTACLHGGQMNCCPLVGGEDL
jgi:hypothetical protein